jgi:hypothetical protein
MCRNEDASKRIVATGNLVFNFELFIGDRGVLTNLDILQIVGVWIIITIGRTAA